MDPTNPFDNLSAFGSLSPPPTNITPQPPQQQPAAPSFLDRLAAFHAGAQQGGLIGGINGAVNGTAPQQQPPQQGAPQQQRPQPQPQQQAPQQPQFMQPQQIQMAQPNYGMLSAMLSHLQPAR